MRNCSREDRALKALFLGPQAENSAWLEREWQKVLVHWVGWRRSLFPQDGRAVSQDDQESSGFRERQDSMLHLFEELLSALDRESPKFTPRYLGHMTSEIALPALLGHVAALLHNPNQTSREVSQVTSRIEAEAIADLLALVHFPSEGRGHFTSGGTMANFEFLWRAIFRLDRTLSLALLLCERGGFARESFARLPILSWQWFERESAKLPAAELELERLSMIRLGQIEFSRIYRRISGFDYQPPVLLAPASRHYSWPKAMALTGLGMENLWELSLDENGRLSLDSLRDCFRRAHTENRGVLMCVSVAGATGTGAVDPVDQVQSFLDSGEEAVWHHVDAAYGGYFCSILGGPQEEALSLDSTRAFSALARVNSLTLDPHKLGFVPYACGAFLARDSFHYRSPSFAAPYLRTDNQGAWMHTIEGSRAATGAAACWMANKAIGLGHEGYGRVLGKGREAALALASALRERSETLLLLDPIDLNILNFSLVREGESLSRGNARTEACFRLFQASPNFAISKTELSCEMMRELLKRHLLPRKVEIDAPTMVCLRLVLMNPFFNTRETVTQYLQGFRAELENFISRLP